MSRGRPVRNALWLDAQCVASECHAMTLSSLVRVPTRAIQLHIFAEVRP